MININALKLSDDVIDNLVSKIEYLDEKYAETLADIDQQISDTENELISMIDQLVGSEEDMLGLEAFKSLLGGE